MQIYCSKRETPITAIAAQFLLGIAGLALITFVCFQSALALRGRPLLM